MRNNNNDANENHPALDKKENGEIWIWMYVTMVQMFLVPGGGGGGKVV